MLGREYKLRAFVVVGVLASAAVLASLSGAAFAQQAPPTSPWPVLQIANPGPGSVVSSGDYWISGSAYDPTSTQGSGVSRVDLFLGDRDEGGIFLGSAVPGQDVLEGLTTGSTTAQDSFQVKVSLPSTVSGDHDLHAYAYSGLTGETTVVAFPIYIAVAPTPMATAAPAPVASIEHLAGIPATGATFSLGNPTAGDFIPAGDYVVSGAAGSTIDRVQLFLDERDTGGTMLGTATPTNGTFMVTVKIPTTMTGEHSFVAYAYSSATGQETKVSVPIQLGTPATPTPRPSAT